MPNTPQTPAENNNANQGIINAIVQGVAQRIADADREADLSHVAFSAGKFEEYFTQTGEEAKKGIEDEYEREFGSSSEGGDREESS